jgi:hypothetical protein
VVASVDLENCIRPSVPTPGTFMSVPSDEPGALVRIRSQLARTRTRELLTVKIVRAHGGCLGTRRRRRTWTAAISHGEALNSL